MMDATHKIACKEYMMERGLVAITVVRRVKEVQYVKNTVQAEHLKIRREDKLIDRTQYRMQIYDRGLLICTL